MAATVTGDGTFNGGIPNGFALATDFASLERKMDGVNNGMCDGFYATANGMNTGFAAVQNALCQGFSGVIRCRETPYRVRRIPPHGFWVRAPSRGAVCIRFHR